MPAPVSYPPKTDADLSAWSVNFNSLVATGYASYGLSSAQATAFTTAKSDYISKLATASNPATRTKSTVAAKNTSRAALLGLIHSYAAIVQAFPTISPTQLADLGLTIRKTTPTPIPVPATKPIITPMNSTANNLYVRFADETTPALRARPFGVIGMEVAASTALTPPVSGDACSFKCILTKNTSGPGTKVATVPFSPADIGKTAYVYGRWFNRRGELGPWSSVATATIAA